MIDFELDKVSGDLIFTGFDFQLVDETNQIIQNLAIRLRFVLGEWFLDINQGVPYYEFFFIKAPNLIQIESILKEEIVSTRGIEELISFTSDYNSRLRIFSVRFSARSVSGETLLKEMELQV